MVWYLRTRVVSKIVRIITLHLFCSLVSNLTINPARLSGPSETTRFLSTRLGIPTTLT